MASKAKRKDIATLLADYMNILPPGPQSAYVPAGDNFGAEESWPITAELERRMEEGSLIGETYAILDATLKILDKEHPEWYNGVLAVFLHPEAGHSDLEFLRRQNPANTTLLCADAGVNWLADHIDEANVFVRRAAVSDTTKREQEMQHKNDEVAAAYGRYIESGLEHKDAINNVALKYEKEYTKRQIRDLVKERTNE